jgi:excisionase family DNA binding protein
MVTMTDEPALKVAEVAARLRLNPETVRRWLNAGKLRGYRLGKTSAGWRVPESEVRRIIAEGSAQPDGDT